MIDQPPEYRSLLVLRNNALEQEMYELAIVYGWSLIRIGCELLDEQWANGSKSATS